MDPRLCRQFIVSRGFCYSYYFCAPQGDRPTLLFVHGFPSLASHWVHQIAFFESKGYGLIVPDCLGYGGTSKPTEKEAYANTLLARDQIEILDHEAVTKVVVIGHDWGSAIVSRIANLYQEDVRFLGFGFLAAGYVTPVPNADYEQRKGAMQKIVGYEVIGYWAFFSDPDAPSLIKDHIDSFIDLVWPQDAPRVWIEQFVPTGAARKFITSNTTVERLSTLTAEEYAEIKESFLRNGFEGPVNYYKINTSNIDREDSKGIPAEAYFIKKPVIFLGADRDGCCPPSLYRQVLDTFAPHHVSEILNSSHWIQWDCKDEVNTKLENWLTNL